MSNLDELFENKLKEKRIMSQRECMRSNYNDFTDVAKKLGEKYKDEVHKLKNIKKYYHPTTIYIEENIHKQLKQVASEKETTMADIIRKAVFIYIKQYYESKNVRKM